MPDYRKKKRNRLFYTQPKSKKIARNKQYEEKIQMKPSASGNKKSNAPEIKVVKGKKHENKRRFKVWTSFCAAVLVIVVFFQMLLPGGIIENISVATALLGSGSYPLELESTETVNAVSGGAYYYVLSNTHIEAFTSSGKRLFSHAHGFENPVIKKSATRALVFNQGGTETLIFTLRGLKTTINTKKSIITAAISDSGAYAIATKSDKYEAAVTVYKKNNEITYEWYSAEDTVNNVALSPNGKKLAVSVFNSNSGVYKSKLSVLNYKSATPEFSQTFEGTIIYSLDSSYSSGFGVITSNSFDFIKWRKYKKVQYKNEYSTAFFRAGKGGFLAVYNRENDKTDNRIAIFSRTGVLKAEFEYKGIISDIALINGHIYCMCDTEIYLLNDGGKVLRNASCGFGAVRLSVLNSNTVVVITDNKIEKIKLEQGSSK